MNQEAVGTAPAESTLTRILGWIERAGNRLPDPALLFASLMLLVWLLSWWMSSMTFDVIDPRNGEQLVVRNLLAGDAIARFMADFWRVFINFPPLGTVVVAMLGIGVADASGMINAGLRAILGVTARQLLTPMVVAVGLLSHAAVDAGYVLVIPLGAVIFYAAGRHPLAGLAAAFAGVSGGFSACFVPTSIDPLLSGIATSAAQIIDPTAEVGSLNNYFFAVGSSLLIVFLGWFVTDRIVEPYLKRTTPVDGDMSGMPTLEPLAPKEKLGLSLALAAMAGGLALVVLTALPEASPWRSPTPPNGLTQTDAPLMQSIVALIFFLFLVPGIVYGFATGVFRNHRDVIAGMSKAMSGLGYYLVMAFFAAHFINAFTQSNLGALLALTGADWLKAAGLHNMVTMVGIIALTGLTNLLIGSASAKWALLAPIFVPMLMQLGVSPDVTQAAYRIGDSSTNIITPLLPYFPLIVLFCRKYVQSAGIGTVVATMLPYSVVFLVVWTAFFMGWWALELPLGFAASYTWPPTF
jgi:aminobenzoyl-glutamate transport protein